MDIEFPHLSKRKLDKIRGSVITTLDGHHHYKACGGEVSSAVDMAEKLLNEGGACEEVKGLLEQAVRIEHPVVGSLIEIEHLKLHGEVFYLGKAILEVLN